jgi:magnesium-transporting ATPase (P-type)
MRLNQRGQAQDVIVWGVLIFALAIAAVVGWYALNSLSSGLPVTSAGNFMDMGKVGLITFGTVLVIVFALGLVVIAALAWSIKASPVYIGVAFLMIIPVILVFSALAASWGGIHTPALLPAFNAFPLFDYLMDKLVYIGVIGTGLVIIALYAGWQS